MKVQVHLNDLLLGTLAMINGRTFFEFSSDYLSLGRPSPSPLHLPLRSGVFLCEKTAMLNLPGCCYDSLPDAWGQKIAELWFQTRGRKSLDEVMPLEQLCFIGDRGVGALSYRPDIAAEPDTRARELSDALELRRMEIAARAVVEGLAGEVIPDLAALARVGSAGGARPKIWVWMRETDQGLQIAAVNRANLDYVPYLLKFDLHGKGETDREWGRIEHACALMARAAGLRSVNTRLIETTDEKGVRRSHFAIQRFDRSPEGRRIHFHSLAGVMERDFSVGRIDYRDFFSVTAQLTQGNIEELMEVFRRMAFNVSARIRDDHGKNHGFLLRNVGGRERWQLAPTYDAVFASPRHFPIHAMPIAGKSDNLTQDELLALAEEFDLPKQKVSAALEQIKDAIARWSEFADQAGISAGRTDEVGKAMPSLGTATTLTSSRPSRCAAV